MSASSVSSSSHRVGILMCDMGRFVSCIDCHLCLGFPAGADYDTIAKQIELRGCSGSVSAKGDALSARPVKAYTPTLGALNRFDFDHSDTPMWVFNTSTLAFAAVNDAAVRHYGYSRKEFLSMTILDIPPSEDIVPLLREIMLEGIHNSAKELRKHKKKDGSLIDVEITRCETIFNGCVADIVTALDVTGRPHHDAPLLGLKTA